MCSQKTKLWPGRPLPYHDEIFSSWFTRVAHSNGLSSAELYSVCVPDSRLFHIDLDRFPNDSLIEALAQHTGVSYKKIKSLTLSVYHGNVFADQSPKSRLIWIPPANVSVKSFGQQICPFCLLENEEPYARVHWRLSFVTLCPIHQLLLVDRCTKCGKPISLLKLDPILTFHRCFYCGTTLHSGSSQKHPQHAFLLQDMLIRVANGSWAKLGKKHIHPILYFRLLNYMFRLIGCSRFSTGLQDELGLGVINIPKLREIERYNVRYRNILLNLSLTLLKDWPDKFIHTCRQVGISRNKLLKMKFDHPFELVLQIDRYLGEPFFKITSKDIEQAAEYLKAQGIDPTRKELEVLLNFRFSKSHKFSFKETKKHIPSGQSRYWKLDRVNPEVKQAAKKAAHRAGENVGAWVDSVLRKELSRREYE
ncbi:MAG: TniQ family protein [Methylocystaceae bacterium]|nr:TniQ family protein [Methylocystaceae bacterium]